MILQATFIETLEDFLIKEDNTPITPISVSDYVAEDGNKAFVCKNLDGDLMLVRKDDSPIEFTIMREDTTTYEGENGVFTGGRPPTR